MEIVKKIARWILREELNDLQTTVNKQAHDKVEMNKQIASLRERLFGSRKVLLSQTMVECIVKMLPDPNKAGCSLFKFGERNESRCHCCTRIDDENRRRIV